MDRWEPLPRLADCVRPPTDAERVLWAIPVIGWAAAHLMQRSRLRPAVDRVRDQLAARPPVPPDVWGRDPGRQEFAYAFCHVLAHEAGWAPAALAPDDPLATLCHASPSDNVGTAVALALGDHLGRPISKEQWAWLEQRTLGEAVDALLPHARQACHACDYDLTGNVTGTCPECGAQTRHA